MNDIKRDFENFLNGDPVQPPALSGSTLRRISRDIDPTFAQAFTKFLGLHGVALATTLTVCPQFGLGPIGGGHGIMHLVMRYGEIACAVFCAAVLFGTTLLLAKLFLTKHEVRVVGHRSLLAGCSVAALTFSFFMLLDAVTAGVVVNLATGMIWTVAGAAILSSLRFLSSQQAQA